ncbi:MAG: hypothetical protein WKF63_01595 [Thermomicrobiales bacterium]
MSGEYASKTDVPVSRSRDEVERTLARFGATAFGYMANQQGQIAISFEIKDFRVLMRMQLPDRAQFARDTRGKVRTDTAIERDWEQACRQRWRSLANGVKAKLALIDDGISTVEREFLADIVVPSTGQTYGDMAIPGIIEVYKSHQLPPLVPGSSGAKVVALGERSGS